jgi:hypothetical protein
MCVLKCKNPFCKTSLSRRTLSISRSLVKKEREREREENLSLVTSVPRRIRCEKLSRPQIYSAFQPHHPLDFPHFSKTKKVRRMILPVVVVLTTTLRRERTTRGTSFLRGSDQFHRSSNFQASRLRGILRTSSRRRSHSSELVFAWPPLGE